MGSRAVITTAPYDPVNVGIYVHWNGGIESVEGFCQAARDLGFRDPVDDPIYGLARLTSIIALFFGLTGDTSLGIGRCEELDTEGDNGVFLIGAGWEIVGRGDGSPVEDNPNPEQTERIRKSIYVNAHTCEEACKTAHGV